MSRRIALISEHASPLTTPGSVDSGGQNVYVGQLARNLAALGCEVDVFTRRDSRSQPIVQSWLPAVRIINVPAGPAEYVPKERLLPYMDDFADYMRRFIDAQHSYDLIHANFWMSAYVGQIIKEACGIPLVITFHALGKVRLAHQATADGFPRERVAIETDTMRAADRIIAECPQDESDQVDLYGADPGKIRMIPCGFDPSELFPVGKRTARERIGLDPHEFIALQLGRLVPRKGVDTVVGAVGLAARRGVKVRLLIVGGSTREPDPVATPEIARLQQLVDDLKIRNHVTFVGQRDRHEIRDYYSAADVFVTTPWYEPFGITPLESMACGTPVIGASVGGIKFSVRHAFTGYLVPPRRPDSVADALEHLFKHRELCATLGRQGLRWVNAQFKWRRVVSDIADVYEELLRSRTPAVMVSPEQQLVPVPSYSR